MVLIPHLFGMGCSLLLTATRDGHGIDSPHPWVVVCHPLILALVMQAESGVGLAKGRIRGGNMDGKAYLGYWIRDKGLYGLCF